MSLFLGMLNFSLFGVLWPMWIAERTRGKALWAAVFVPCVAFWLGWFSR